MNTMHNSLKENAPIHGIIKTTYIYNSEQEDKYISHNGVILCQS